MMHRLGALTGLLCLAMPTVSFSFQSAPPAMAVRRTASSTALTGIMSMSSPGARGQSRDARLVADTGATRRRWEGRQGRALLQQLRSEAAAAGSEESPKPSESSTTGGAAVDDSKGEGGPIKRGFRRVARFFGAGKKMPNIKELGLYALLSYGFVSNASYAICVGLAWFASSKKTGLSPLAPGQWQVFLVSYATLWAINNVLRVPRFALSVSLAPAFDRFIEFLMKKTGRGKGVATGLCVFLVNFLGTFALLSTGILLASIFSGVPFWPAAAAA
ncbi:unnamed protein product [Ectocarpus sp. 8 AP-2014]